MNHQAIFNQATAGSEVPEINSNNNGGDANGGRYKGVVPQPNGHWGAQIYANHQRMWLGTFKTEREAAMAYDSAAVKLRRPDTNRNIPIDNQAVSLEANFQSYLSTEEVLGMIRDGSYQHRLREFCRTHMEGMAGRAKVLRCGGENGREVYYTEFFEKELTPSDVGKLNRLVIPKKHAVKFFPQLNHQNMENQGFGNSCSVELDFVDRSLRNWRFRYCYWRSSQSFVLTRGWNRFVKDKRLTTRDVVLFYGCEMAVEREGRREIRRFCMIDVRYHQQQDEGAVPVTAEAVADEAGPSRVHEGGNNVREENGEETETRRLGFRLFGANNAREENGEDAERKRAVGFKLFGVQING